MIEIPSWALPSYFLIYFLLAFVMRSWLVWHKTGINPYRLPRTDDAYGLVTSGFRKVILVLIIYLVLQSIWVELETYLGAIRWLDHSFLDYIGWSGLIVAAFWVLVAQAQMGLSWRIGIDTDHRTELVTKGLFSLSRNPIFLSMRVTLLCLFLIKPNALTLCAWLLGDVLMQFQVRLEEDYLLQAHGHGYAAYSSRVRRWI